MANKCLNKSLELTLAIIKPHIVKHPHALINIREKILDMNFKIVRSKRKCLLLSDAEKFYEEHQKKFFYNRLVHFMTSGPSEFYILCKENAIKDWRDFMGPTKVSQSQFIASESIRGSYGFSDTRNATHGSDSRESAQREIGIFFPEFNFQSWYDNEEKFFRTNDVKFDRDKFLHVINMNK